jgi:hypothetical protein
MEEFVGNGFIVVTVLLDAVVSAAFALPVAAHLLSQDFTQPALPGCLRGCHHFCFSLSAGCITNGSASS